MAEGLPPESRHLHRRRGANQANRAADGLKYAPPESRRP